MRSGRRRWSTHVRICAVAGGVLVQGKVLEKPPKGNTTVCLMSQEGREGGGRGGV